MHSYNNDLTGVLLTSLLGLGEEKAVPAMILVSL